MGLELPPFPSGELPEREMLESYLHWYRVVVVRKVEGLPRDLAIRPMPPGILSALGVVQHLGWVERGWSRRAVLGEEYPVPWNDADPDADLRIEDDETVDSVIAFYRSEWEAADAIWSTRALDDTGLDHGRTVSIRWILNHMIEETGAPRRPPRPHRRSPRRPHRRLTLARDALCISLHVPGRPVRQMLQPAALRSLQVGQTG